MMLNLIGAVELTASAALVIAAVSFAFGPDGVTRLRLALGLSAWFVAVVALAASRALHVDNAGVFGVGLAVVIPLAALWLGLLRVPSLRARLEHAPLALLAAMHSVRLLGVSFVLLHSAGRLPAPFAPVAGWGDIAIGAAALPVAWLVARQAKGWRPTLLIWNTLGLADLAAAVILGVLSSPGPLRIIDAEPGTGIMATLPWLLIPGFLVPLLAVTHLAIFHRLARQVPDAIASPDTPPAHARSIAR